MLPEIGGLEWLVIAVVALVVIGPKDLPVMMRKLGQFTAKLRGMANEFRASFDEMARQSELDELRKEVEAMRRGQFGGQDYASEMRSTVGEIEQQMADVGVQLHAPMGYGYSDPAAPPVAISDAPSPDAAAAAEPPAKPKRVRKTAASADDAAAPKPRAKAAADGQPKSPRKRSPKIVEGGA